MLISTNPFLKKMKKELLKPLSNVQLELLEVFSTGIPDDQLLEIKELIANYLFKQSVAKADKLWEEKGYNQETISQWLNED
jgi:hypothetical protein